MLENESKCLDGIELSELIGNKNLTWKDFELYTNTIAIDVYESQHSICYDIGNGQVLYVYNNINYEEEWVYDKDDKPYFIGDIRNL